MLSTGHSYTAASTASAMSILSKSHTYTPRITSAHILSAAQPNAKKLMHPCAQFAQLATVSNPDLTLILTLQSISHVHG